MFHKVVIIGPESTGKSHLSAQLAAHFKTSWCPEFAREYLHEKISYTYDDLLLIAKGQLALEDSYYEKGKKTSNLLFVDTDMYVMKVWCEFVFGKCHRFILDRIVDRHYDLYLLCNTDLPWTRDRLREHPDLATRKILYKHYRDIMINQHVPWAEITGEHEERFRQAVEAVNTLL